MWTDRQKQRQAIDRLMELLFTGYRDAERSQEPSPSPFLYQRVRQRIEAERQRRMEEGNSWNLLILEARHVLPVLTVIAVAIIGLAASPTPPLFSPSQGSATVQRTTPGKGQGAQPNGLLPSEILPFSNEELMAAAVE
jgi:hypothetical protein